MSSVGALLGACPLYAVNQLLGLGRELVEPVCRTREGDGHRIAFDPDATQRHFQACFPEPCAALLRLLTQTLELPEVFEGHHLRVPFVPSADTASSVRSA